MYKGPDWWVKIADFGISKRATEGSTALHTQIGSPGFTAPEVLGIIPQGNGSDDSYTNAVDIWSLGVITFLILTGETLFSNPRRLGRYVSGSFQFPSDVLRANKVSENGCKFVKQLMAAKSEDRPSAKECLQHIWLASLIEDFADETRRY
jgi:serine/threonine protein kinase